VDDTSFQPTEILAALERHGVRYVVIGGLAATLHGSPVVTTDADICPARDRDNLDRLARALNELRARIRTADVAGGLAFTCDAVFLSRIEVVLNLTTRFGDLDISIVPSGTGGFEDLRQQAVTISLAGHPVAVASLEDVIRSKEAANRPKDLAALPTLRLLLQRLRRG
jgi:predicted nucleotidyltransferase